MRRLSIVKRFITTGVLALVLSMGLVGSSFADNITIGGPSDCDNNAVISCGAHSTNALMNAYQSSNYVQTVFSSMGISGTEMSNLKSTNVAGRVTSSGNVFVEGQSTPVARDAMTVGRQNMPGSTKVIANGHTFYKRPPSVSFQQNSLPAFVAMSSSGKFKFAIIASCGNAVAATAIVVQKPAPKPAPTPTPKPAPTPAPAAVPAPTQTQSQSQSQSVTVQQVTPTPPAPAPAPVVVAPAVQTTPVATQSLPNTGPVGVIGVFGAAVALGYFAYRRFIVHRLFQ